MKIINDLQIVIPHLMTQTRYTPKVCKRGGHAHGICSYTEYLLFKISFRKFIGAGGGCKHPSKRKSPLSRSMYNGQVGSCVDYDKVTLSFSVLVFRGVDGFERYCPFPLWRQILILCCVIMHVVFALFLVYMSPNW